MDMLESYQLPFLWWDTFREIKRIIEIKWKYHVVSNITYNVGHANMFIVKVSHIHGSVSFLAC